MGGAAPTVDAVGNVYVADGNGNATSSGDAFDHSDAVLKLSPTMQLLDWFAPTSWASDNAGDQDLGSGAPQLLSDGQVLQVGKTHTGYLLNPAHLGHIDGAVRTFSVCSGGVSFGGDAVVGSLVVVACSDGLNAVKVTTSPPFGTVKWTSNVTGTSPVYAAGLVWSISGSTGGSTLYALNPANGNVKWQYSFGGVLNHFATPSVGDNLVLVASQTTLLAFPPG
jgi:outer membrane protein assembly factor BamB